MVSQRRQIGRKRALSSHIVDVSAIAQEMRAPVRAYAQQHTVTLAGVLAGADDCSYARVYSDWIAETFAHDGLHYQLHTLPSSASPRDVAKLIRSLNTQPDIHGILVFYPIFAHQPSTRRRWLHQATGVYYKTDDDWLRDVVHPTKDVEGLHQQTKQKFFQARAADRDQVYVPCTALAVQRIVAALRPKSGTTVTIVNRSEIMGRPLAALLSLQHGSTVYSVDETSILVFDKDGHAVRSTHTLEDCIFESSVVVTGVPDPHFEIPLAAIQPQTLLIDVSEYDNVAVDAVAAIPGVQVVSSIGKVTIAALEQNLVQLHKTAAATSTNVYNIENG